MSEDYPKHTITRKHLRASSPSRVTDNVHCLDCARARRDGRPWGCRVHVAEEVLP